MPSGSKSRFILKTKTNRTADYAASIAATWGSIGGNIITQTDLVEPITVVNTDTNYTETRGWNKVVKHTGTLTADRTITLPSGTANDKMYFTRTGAGAFNLSIGGLKNLTTNTWCVVRYRAGAWELFQYGTL